MSARSSSLEMALLGLLRQKPQSGYDVRKLFTTTPMRHFSDSPGSIYPALRRLQQRHWIHGEQESGRKRQVFRVTAAGRKKFLEWLQQPVRSEDVVWDFDQLLLRFAFFDGNVRRKHTRAFLNEFIAGVEAYIRELEQYGAEAQFLDSSSTGALAFCNGLEGYRAQLRWARNALRRISEASQ